MKDYKRIDKKVRIGTILSDLNQTEAKIFIHFEKFCDRKPGFIFSFCEQKK